MKQTWFLGACLVALAWSAASCSKGPDTPRLAAPDPHLATNGTVEVTARLEEIPDGAIFKRDLYDYATILKYQVLRCIGARWKGTRFT